MTVLTRALAPAVLVTLLAAGCASSSPSSTTAARASQPATQAASQAAPSAPATSAATSPAATGAGAPPATSTVASGPSGPDVYFAESQDVNGTTAHAPACQAGCPVSGDGTTVLWDMAWPTWTGTEAVGAGTEKIDGCDPNCAAGKQYAVQVTVTFSQPVKDCAGGGRWFWTHASFTWPKGLPSAVSGASAPTNPVDFAQVKAQAAQSCG